MKTSEIISTLKKDGIVVMPTDTLYGILGSAFSKKAVKRIFEIKGRNSKKPLIVLIDSIGRLQDFDITLSSDSRNPLLDTLKKIWPDKITAILPCLSEKFKYIHRGSGSIAFRMPKDKKLLTLLSKTGPLVAPSANPEGMTPAKNIIEVKKYFGDKIDLYVGGRINSSEPSTIIKYEKGEWELVREGAVKASSEKLQTLLI